MQIDQIQPGGYAVLPGMYDGFSGSGEKEGAMLELQNRKLAHAVMICAKGGLDATTSGILEARCGGLLHAGCQCVVLDFNELRFLSSAGLRTLLGLSKRIQAGGGKLVFTGIHGRIRDMFDIVGFLDAFPVVDPFDPGLA
jgi:anti-anti-sigma factor